MKLAFICEMPPEHFVWWKDGLYAALSYLRENYGWEIGVFNIPSLSSPTIDIEGWDFGLFWGALNRPQHKFKIFPKQGLCFSGGPHVDSSLTNFDVVFAESDLDLEEFKKQNINVVKAFGTNTQLFRPIPEQPKVFDYLYSAAYALWKRHNLFAETVVSRKATGLAVGYMQPDGWEKECYEICQKNGIPALDWVPPQTLVYLYNMARKVLITANPDGGCQRTVLEAKACNIPVEILSDSPKLLELKYLTRDEVLNNWSEKSYGEALKKGIEGVL